MNLFSFVGSSGSGRRKKRAVVDTSTCLTDTAVR
jgi:hypothetical protein